VKRNIPQDVIKHFGASFFEYRSSEIFVEQKVDFRVQPGQAIRFNIPMKKNPGGELGMLTLERCTPVPLHIVRLLGMVHNGQFHLEFDLE